MASAGAVRLFECGGEAVHVRVGELLVDGEFEECPEQRFAVG
jgi:hypothetical protein